MEAEEYDACLMVGVCAPWLLEAGVRHTADQLGRHRLPDAARVCRETLGVGLRRRVSVCTVADTESEKEFDSLVDTGELD